SACRAPRTCPRPGPSSARSRRRARQAASGTRERRGGRSRSPRLVSSLRRCIRAGRERVRASSSRRLRRRWQVRLSRAHPYFLPAIRADRSLGSVDPDTDRLPVAEIDDANVDAWLDALRIQVLEEAGLVLALIWDTFHGRRRPWRDALERLGRSGRHAGPGVAMRAGLRIAEHVLNPPLHLR